MLTRSFFNPSITTLPTVLVGNIYNPQRIVCLLHGYGSCATNLLPLVHALQSKHTSVLWALPQGILTWEKDNLISTCTPKAIEDGELTQPSAWWPLDLTARAYFRSGQMSESELTAYYAQEPAGIDHARAAIIKWTNQLSQIYKLPLDKFILGGFSQGAMLSADVSVHLNTSLQGICLFSGSLINAHQWSQLTHITPQRFFQSHGTYDDVLPLHGGQALYHYLQSQGYQGEWVEFSGYHDIPNTVIMAAKSYFDW